MNTIEDMINSLVQGDKEAATDQFNAIFSEKAAAALDQYKQEVGKEFFNQKNEETIDEVNQQTMNKLVSDTVKKHPLQGRTGDNPGQYPPEGLAKLRRIQSMQRKLSARPSEKEAAEKRQNAAIVAQGEKYQGRY